MADCKRLVSLTLLPCLTAMLPCLLGCATPLTPGVLAYCERRDEVPMEFRRAGLDEKRILVTYEAAVRPWNSSTTELGRKSRWVEIDVSATTPVIRWQYAKPSDLILEAIEANPIPLGYDRGVRRRFLSTDAQELQYAILAHDCQSAHAFSLLARGSGAGERVLCRRASDHRELPAPSGRFVAYVTIVPVAVVYDAVTLPFWIRSSGFTVGTLYNLW